MEIAITGGTGFLGTHLGTELVDRGHGVTAISRDPEESDLPPGVDCRAADVTAYPELADAIAGAEAVVHLVALSPLFEPAGGPGAHESVHLQGTRNVVRAMESAGIDRLLHLSGIGAHPEAPTAFLRTKGRAEAVVRAADIAPTVVRPAAIFGEGGEFLQFIRLVTTPYLTALPGGGRTPFQPIWVGDMTAMLADTLEAADRAGATYTLGGPEVLTLADVTRLVHGAAGRPVRIVPVPMRLAGLGLALADPIPFVPLGREQYRSLRLTHTVPENDIDALGRTADDLMGLQEYLENDAPQR